MHPHHAACTTLEQPLQVGVGHSGSIGRWALLAPSPTHTAPRHSGPTRMQIHACAHTSTRAHAFVHTQTKQRPCRPGAESEEPTAGRSLRSTAQDGAPAASTVAGVRHAPTPLSAGRGQPGKEPPHQPSDDG